MKPVVVISAGSLGPCKTSALLTRSLGLPWICPCLFQLSLELRWRQSSLFGGHTLLDVDFVFSLVMFLRRSQHVYGVIVHTGALVLTSTMRLLCGTWINVLLHTGASS